jgi:hypothetical protein
VAETPRVLTKAKCPRGAVPLAAASRTVVSRLDKASGLPYVPLTYLVLRYDITS